MAGDTDLWARALGCASRHRDKRRGRGGASGPWALGAQKSNAHVPRKALPAARTRGVKLTEARVAGATGADGQDQGWEGRAAPLSRLDSARSQGGPLLRADTWPAPRKARRAGRVRDGRS